MKNKKQVFSLYSIDAKVLKGQTKENAVGIIESLALKDQTEGDTKGSAYTFKECFWQSFSL